MQVITLPELCGYYSVENLLLERRKVASEADHIELNFREMAWIGTLPLSLLYSWIRQIQGKGTAVTFNLNETKTNINALRLLSRTGFFHKLLDERIGPGSIPIPAEEGMAAFQVFNSIDELSNYERALNASASVDDLLRGGSDIHLVNAGYLREILLHELGENAFLHGAGQAVRFIALQRRERARPDRGGFDAFFNGRPTVEILIADDGPGLVEKLRPMVPSDWQPKQKTNRKLSIGAKVCAFALEFSATSDLEGRKRRLRDILSTADNATESIPTGLYYVATLVRHYGGQLVIRTGRNLVSFNFEQPGDPDILEDAIGHQGSDVKGTHVLVRIAKDARPVRRPSSMRVVSTAAASDDQVYELALESVWLEAARDPAEFIVRVEKMVDGLLSRPGGLPRRVLTLLAHGLSADTKTIALLLTWLGSIPHHNWMVVVYGLDSELFESAKRQSERLLLLTNAEYGSRYRLRAWQPFAVMDSQLRDVCMLGGAGTDVPVSSALMSWHALAVTQRIKTMLDTPPVRQREAENRYYLIEGKYYTKRFYEIRQLISPSFNKIGTSLSAALIAHWIRETGATKVLILAMPLFELATTLPMFISGVEVVLAAAEGSAPIARELVLGDKDTKYLFLTDVICTGRQFFAHFEKVRQPENCWIGAFVDARDNKNQYITVERSDRPYRVPVFAALRTSIPAIHHLPDVDEADILLIDRHTHAPTPKEQLAELMMSPHDLIAVAHQAKALLHGHIELKHKHYIDLIDFRRLFEQLRNEIYRFFDRTLEQLKGLKLEAKNVCVFYLHEERGWEEMIPQYMSARGIPTPQKLSRAALFAPPPVGEAAIDGRCIWFILPAIASGETMRQCIEFASRLRAKSDDGSSVESLQVFISIIIGRMHPAELSFYQGIRAFKKLQVLMQVLAFVPLPAYPSANDCPICLILRTTDSNALRIDNSPTVKSSYVSARREIASESLDGKVVDSKRWSLHDATLSQMSAIYRLGVRDIGARRKMAELLETEEGRRCFLEMVGAHCDGGAFESGAVQRQLYKAYEPLKVTATDLIRSCDLESVTLRELLGIHVLFPDLLSLEISALTLAALKSEGPLLSRIVFLALLHPEEYGRSVTIAAHVATEVTQCNESLAKEVRACSLWFGNDAALAIDAFEDLLWLLRRSTDWGSGLEELRARLGQADDSSRIPIEAAYRAFEISGINRAAGRMASIKCADGGVGLWTAILAEGGKPDLYIGEITLLALEMRALARLGSAARSDLQRSLIELDRSGKRLFRELHRPVFTNPARIKREIEKLERWPDLQRWPVGVRCEIAPDCPGLLFGFGHLMSALNAVLENVSKFLRDSANGGLLPENSGDLWIEFRFIGFNLERDRALLEVHGNVPFGKPLKPQGGLKQAADHCRIYGALLEFSSEMPPHPSRYMRFHLRIDTSGRERDLDVKN